MEKSARWLELVCMSWMRTKVETGEFLGHSPAGRQMTVVGRLWGLVELYTGDTVRGSEVKVVPVSIVRQLITNSVSHRQYLADLDFRCNITVHGAVLLTS